MKFVGSTFRNANADVRSAATSLTILVSHWSFALLIGCIHPINPIKVFLDSDIPLHVPAREQAMGSLAELHQAMSWNLPAGILFSEADLNSHWASR